MVDVIVFCDNITVVSTKCLPYYLASTRAFSGDASLPCISDWETMQLNCANIYISCCNTQQIKLRACPMLVYRFISVFEHAFSDVVK